MTSAQASDLLRNNYINTNKKTVWADLGAGSGTFTLALAGFLRPDSTIYAIDTSKEALKAIPASHNQVRIDPHLADFVRDDLPFPKVDGLLMANSLHYVPNQVAFLEKMGMHVKETNCLLIVEYDTNDPSPTWVPYPLSYHSLSNLVYQVGYQVIYKLQEQPSIYGNATLYSALAVRGASR